MSKIEPRKEAENTTAKASTTASVVGFFTGYSSMQRQAAILRNRLSFPLLRQVLAGELESQKSLVMLDQLSTQQLARSCIGHMLILLVTVPSGIWALLTLTLGVAAAVRFGVYLNTWLMTGIPLTIFTTVTAAKSFKAYRLFRAELIARRLTDA
ncbi:hypothetical protein [Pseudomonas sp. EA_35y_Pfl2_R5]|uniref:hypothetical protein n=1 Tax=Pseudomonas sp. EA_35y_Pfl2_R5 TaxID=3088690 RepID=UPI0030DA2F5E